MNRIDELLSLYDKILDKDIQAGFDLLEWAVDLVMPKEDLLGDTRHINGLKAYRDFKEGKISAEVLNMIIDDVWNVIICMEAYRDAIKDGYELYSSALPLRYIIDTMIDGVWACHNLINGLLYKDMHGKIYLRSGIKRAFEVSPVLAGDIEKKIEEKYNELFGGN